MKQRNIVCTEDRKCTLEPMASVNQSGGGGGSAGLVPGEEDYVIPISTESLKKNSRKQTGKGCPRKQTGSGISKQKGKGKRKIRKSLSSTKASKGKGRKKRTTKHKNKSVPWTIQ